MIPHPIVRRSVSRRHERGDDRRRARLHAVLAPPGVRLGEPDRVHPGLVHDARRLEHLVEWLHGELHDADPKRWRHDGSRQESSVECVGPSGSDSYASGDAGWIPASAPSAGEPATCTRCLERLEHLGDLLVHDRLQHALTHRADRAGDLDVRLPGHRGAALDLLERERGRHVHQRADALALCPHRREDGLALLELLEVHRHLQPAEAERHLDLRRPVRVVGDLEGLDAGHQLRHLATAR